VRLTFALTFLTRRRPPTYPERMAADRNEAFAAHRRACGWTQQALIREYRTTAERLSLPGALTERTVARWEGADPPLPRPAAQSVLEALFGVPLHELGFAVPTQRRSPAVDRRRFLGDAGALTAAAVLAAAADGHGSRVEGGHLRAIDEAMERVYVLDHGAGSRAAQRAAHELAGRITALLSRGSYLDTVGRSLQASLGAVTGHLGWLGYDAGQPDAARSHCLEALHLARMTGDRALEARSLATLSLVALEQGRDWEARSAASTAWDTARGWADPTVRAMLGVREAGALSQAGDHTGARRALSQATANFDRSADGSGSPRWARFFGAGELNQATGAYYLAAGRPTAAVPFLQATLRELGPSYTRNAASYRAKLALALLAAGSVDEACAEAEEVCAWLDRVESAKILARLREFRTLAAGTGARCATQTIERIDRVLGTAA
jgi:hypothetical protein